MPPSEVKAVSLVVADDEVDMNKLSALTDEEVRDSNGRLKEIKFSCGCCKVSERMYLLFLFTVINVFLFADQNLLAPNLTVIADEFGMDEAQRDMYIGGYISLGLFAVGGFVALVVGYLTDRYTRKWVFATTVTIGEISCALTYIVPTGSITDFWYGLWLTRAVTGMALGGALPIQYSIIGDLFTDKDRGKAIAFFSFAIGLGFGSGQYAANLCTPDWRTPFLAVSIPSLFLVLLFVLTTKEPQRGASERLLKGKLRSNTLSPNITWKKVRQLFKTPTVMLIILHGVPATLPYGIFSVYLNDFLLVEKEQEASKIANLLLAYGLFVTISVFIGGFLTDKLIRTRPKLLMIIAGCTTMLTPVPFFSILRSEPQVFGFYYALLLPGALMTAISSPIIKGLLLQITLPETRGTAFALQTLMDEIGKGVGPFLLSLVIRAVSSREDGLVIGIMGWIPAGLILLFIPLFLSNDMKRYEAALADAYDLELKDSVEDAGEDDLSLAERDKSLKSKFGPRLCL